MSATAYSAAMGNGQAGFDTIVLTDVNNGLGFVVAAPLGGVMPYSAADIYKSTPSTPPPVTPARTAMSINASFTASSMQIRLTGLGGGTVPTVPVNYFFMYGASSASLAQGAINVAMPYSGTPGGFPSQPTGLVYSDTQNHDWIPAGDVACLCIGFAAGSGSICAATVEWQADFTSGIGYPITSSLSNNSAAHVPANIYAASRRWVAASGCFYEVNTANPGLVQQLMPASGTWSNLEVLVDSVGGTDSYWRQFQSFHGPNFLSTDPGVGGMPYGAQLVRWTGVTAGMTSVLKFDSQNHDWVPAGDLIGTEYSGQSSSSQNTYYMGMTSLFTPSNPNTTPMLSGGNPWHNTTAALSWNQVSGGGGGFRPSSANTSEALTVLPMSGTFSGLNVVCGVVNGTSTASGAFYANTADDKGTSFGAQALSNIGAGGALGVTKDTQHHDWVPAGDGYCFTVTGFDSTFTLNSQSVAFTSLGPGRDRMLMFGVG